MTTASELERDIVRSFKRRQRYSTYLGILLVALITASVAVFLAYSLREIAGIQEQIYTLRQDKTDLEKSNADLQITLTQTIEKLKEAQKKLAKSTDLADHVHDLNWNDLKLIAMDAGRAFDILLQIDRMRLAGAQWSFDNSRGGYNSPTFAAAVLDRLHLPNNLEALPMRQGAPHPGDLIRYGGGGYTMFYFRDSSKAGAQRDFVVGMTPFGVIALDMDFGVPMIEVRITGLSQ